MKEIKEEIKKLLKREYLRGIIDGQGVKLSEKYTMTELNKIYKKYKKYNPIQ